MRILPAFILFSSIAGLACADPVPSCPTTVTSCTLTVSAGGQAVYNTSLYQNPTPFWETEPVSGWPVVFRLLLSPSELASGQIPYNVEYDFGAGISVSTNASAQLTVDFNLPASVTNWIVIGYPDNYGSNNAEVLSAGGGDIGAGGFANGPGSAYVLTGVPGEFVFRQGWNDNNGGGGVFEGILIGEIATVPEPGTGWLVLAGALMAGGAGLLGRRRAMARSILIQ